MVPYYDKDGITIYCGDCRKVIPHIGIVDAVVTDPPYGLGFMGRTWDSTVPPVELWETVFDALKPGGHLLSFAGTRTHHRMAVNIEDAGFEIRDMIAWVYGCLSEDTEVLTKDGWVKYEDAIPHKVLTYDVENDIYKWEKPSRWNEYRVESDTAYRIQSDDTDQIVSRGHRCIVERGGALTFVPADELAGVERVPYLQNGFPALSKGCGELLLEAVLRESQGMAEMSCGERQGQETPWQRYVGGEESCMEGRADLLQTQGQVCRPANQVCSLPCCVHRDGPQGRLCHGASADCGNGDWATVDAKGVCPPRQPRCDGQPIGEPDAVCDKRRSQAVRARASYRTTLATVTAIKYSGMIWCPTVSTGAFLARRNGKVFITGNSGFPKSMDVSKAIDKAAGVERQIIGTAAEFSRDGAVRKTDGSHSVPHGEQGGHGFGDRWASPVTVPSTDAAKQWEGWGTALKPALEPITMARKPLLGTVADNVQKHGTGALNIGGCRVGDEDVSSSAIRKPGTLKHGGTNHRPHHDNPAGKTVHGSTCGRWPANLIHDGSDQVVEQFPETTSGANPTRRSSAKFKNAYSEFAGQESCEQHRGADAGNASRFFYCAKASSEDRGPGNNHPTVKPVSLMRWLVRLITCESSIVLDPFMGSGSTLVAAKLEGRKAIGIEMDENYAKIAVERLKSIPPTLF